MYIINRAEFNELRELRLRHLRYGIGSIENKERYLDLIHRAGEYIKTLTGDERKVIEFIYIQGRSEVWTSMYLYFSDRHVRRIRKKALDKLDMLNGL